MPLPLSPLYCRAPRTLAARATWSLAIGCGGSSTIAGQGGPAAPADPLTEVIREAGGLGTERLERAVGAIYEPETERESHYILARLSRQFDAAVFFDTTRAVAPLAR